MINTTLLDQVTPELEEFIAECDKLGYKNNNSLKSLKFDWCLENGMWHGTFKDGKLIAISGIHSVSYTHLTLPTILLV